MNKVGPQKSRKYTITLSECEMRRLTAYAASCGVDRPAALGRLVRQSLREAAAGLQSDAAQDLNQLGLFDTLQIDIFNNTSKVN